MNKKRFWIYVYTDFSRTITGWYKVGSHYGLKAEFRVNQQDGTSSPEILETKHSLDITNLVNKVAGKNVSLEYKKSTLLKLEKEIRDYITNNLGYPKREDKEREWVKTYGLNPIYTAIDIIHNQYSVKHKRPVILKPEGKYLWQDLEVVIPALNYFKTCSRGHSIVYCGGGKTMMTYWFIRQLPKQHNLAIIALPSLQLVAQTKNNINKQQIAREEHWNHISICSEPNNNLSNNTTSIEDIKNWLQSTQNDSSLRIIFTTYQSGKVLSEAIKELNQGIDIIIFDESHKATGKRNSLFTHLLDDNNIKADKRWFVTATPKYNLHKREDAFGFNNKEVFGDEICKIDYRTLLKYDMVTAFKLNCLGVNNEVIKEFIEENVWIKLEEFDQETQSRFVASLFALHMAYEQGIVTRVISYHSRNLYAERFEQVLKTLSQSKHPKFPAFYGLEVYRCEGGDTKGNKQKLNALAKAKKAIVTNARVLTEGIDVPAIDGIIFVDPKKSLVDINQAIGRVVRKLEGKKYGHVILPTVFEDNQITNETYAYLGAVMWHISQVDELLKDDITFARDRSPRQVMTTPNINSIVEISTPDYINVNFDEFCNNILLESVSLVSRDYNQYTNEELEELFKDCTSVRECRRILNGRPAIIYVNRGLADKRWPGRTRSRKRSPNEIVNGLKGCSTSSEAAKKDKKLWGAAQREEAKNPGFIEFTLNIKMRKNKTSKYLKDDYDNLIEKHNITKLSEFKKKVNFPFYKKACDKKWTINLEQDIKTGMPGKSVVCKKLDGTFINQFNSATEASQKTGVSVDSICGCAKGRYKTTTSSNGEKYIWNYID